MANVNFYQAFNYAWGESGVADDWTEAQYKLGWAVVGSIPPSVEQFNKIHQMQDQKSNWLFAQIASAAAANNIELSAEDPDGLKKILEVAAPAASTSKAGVVELATNAEAIAGASNSLAIVASSLKATLNNFGIGGTSATVKLLDKDIASGIYTGAGDNETKAPFDQGRLYGAYLLMRGSDATSASALMLDKGRAGFYTYDAVNGEQSYELWHSGNFKPCSKADTLVQITGTGALTGGGDLSMSRSLDLTPEAKASLAKADAAMPAGQTGTAATANVVANARDETAGRVLTVGYFGLGSRDGTDLGFGGVDLNTLTTNGFYGFPADALNTPGTDDGSLLVVGSRREKLQISSITSTGIYFRTNDSDQATGAWGAWNEFYHSANFIRREQLITTSGTFTPTVTGVYEVDIIAGGAGGGGGGGQGATNGTPGSTTTFDTIVATQGYAGRGSSDSNGSGSRTGTKGENGPFGPAAAQAGGSTPLGEEGLPYIYFGGGGGHGYGAGGGGGAGGKTVEADTGQANGGLGGGAGMRITRLVTLTAGTAYTVIIGAGGTGGEPAAGSTGQRGGNGNAGCVRIRYNGKAA